MLSISPSCKEKSCFGPAGRCGEGRGGASSSSLLSFAPASTAFRRLGQCSTYRVQSCRATVKSKLCERSRNCVRKPRHTPTPMYAVRRCPGVGASDSTRSTKYREESSTGSTDFPSTSYGAAAKSSPALVRATHPSRRPRAGSRSGRCTRGCAYVLSRAVSPYRPIRLRDIPLQMSAGVRGRRSIRARRTKPTRMLRP